MQGDFESTFSEGQRPDSEHVEFHATIAGDDTEWIVADINLLEGMDMFSTAQVNLRAAGNVSAESRDYLGKDATFVISRGTQLRHFHGIVRHATFVQLRDEAQLALSVVPALWLATETQDSRIYQDKTVPELVAGLVQELLGSRNRTVRTELTETYLPHEYLVQHRESHFHFLNRLLREEGIFYYFDHDAEGQDHEVLVLADSNEGRPMVRPEDSGVVPYHRDSEAAPGPEVARGFVRDERVGAHDSVVRGFDWTNPELGVHHERTERADFTGPRLEMYHHAHSVRHQDYDADGGTYRQHTADRRSRHDTERLDIYRGSWNMSTTVVTAQPGRLIDLQGAEGHDGRYLIVLASTTGVHNPDGVGTYRNTLGLVPGHLPYRPPAATRRTMPGPETAIVVGPPNEEIHTDRHGRIKVHFHWDRQSQRNEHSSAWIRVAQAWSGPGWGTIFIPRIGMEVIVSFLGGDPDRPIVTGCVYNGTNTVPYTLPDHKTRSTIKTNSSVGGSGYNELRFEDKKHNEEIFLHAQKDLNEVVLNNHSTSVGNDQSNSVDRDQTEHVKRDQTMNVDRNRTKQVKGDETVTIGPDTGKLDTTIHGNEIRTILQNRFTKVTQTDAIQVMEGERSVRVDVGLNYEKYDGGREVNVKSSDRLNVTDGANRVVDVNGDYENRVFGLYTLTHRGANQLSFSDRLIVQVETGIVLFNNNAYLGFSTDGTVDFRGTEMTISGRDKITLKVGDNSKIEIAAGKISITSPTVVVNGSSLVSLNSPTMVKLNSP